MGLVIHSKSPLHKKKICPLYHQYDVIREVENCLRLGGFGLLSMI